MSTYSDAEFITSVQQPICKNIYFIYTQYVLTVLWFSVRGGNLTSKQRGRKLDSSFYVRNRPYEQCHMSFKQWHIVMHTVTNKHIKLTDFHFIYDSIVHLECPQRAQSSQNNHFTTDSFIFSNQPSIHPLALSHWSTACCLFPSVIKHWHLLVHNWFVCAYRHWIWWLSRKVSELTNINHIVFVAL